MDKNGGQKRKIHSAKKVFKSDLKSETTFYRYKRMQSQNFLTFLSTFFVYRMVQTDFYLNKLYCKFTMETIQKMVEENPEITAYGYTKYGDQRSLLKKNQL